jgi:hypothetical protein
MLDFVGAGPIANSCSATKHILLDHLVRTDLSQNAKNST